MNEELDELERVIYRCEVALIDKSLELGDMPDLLQSFELLHEEVRSLELIYCKKMRRLRDLGLWVLVVVAAELAEREPQARRQLR